MESVSPQMCHKKSVSSVSSVKTHAESEWLVIKNDLIWQNKQFMFRYIIVPFIPVPVYTV